MVVMVMMTVMVMMVGDEVPHFYIYKLPIVRLSGCYVKSHVLTLLLHFLV